MNHTKQLTRYIYVILFVLLSGTATSSLADLQATSSSFSLSQNQGNAQAVYLPLLMAPYPSTASLEQQMNQVITNVLAQSGPDYTLLDLHFDWYTLSINLGATISNPEETYEFQELVSTINFAINTLLDDEGYGQNKSFEYEFFINNEPLFTPTADQEPRSFLGTEGVGNKRIVLSPGHGWHLNANGTWGLDRGYHWGIVEDFVNADLVIELAGLMGSTGADIRPARQTNKNVGNHTSGHPWWQMGASEYVRSLGAPGSVWGQSYIGSNRNIVAPPEYANWIQADMLISIHNNGGGGCGTETLYDNSNGYQDQSRRLAQLIQSRVVQQLRQHWDPNWCDRGAKGFNGNYGENRRFRGPAVIVEIAFMDNYSNNQALQNATFRTLVTSAIRDAIVEYYDMTGGGEPRTFIGNPASHLYFDQNGERINLQVCADNIVGQRVYTRLSRPGRNFDVISQYATSRCVTFWDMDGAGPVLANTVYTTRAALNAPPNDSWPVPCYVATGGRGLCDQASYTQNPNPPTTFEGNPFSRLYFDQNGNRINLEVCADNLPAQTVNVRLSRPGHTFSVVSQTAFSRCVTFWDMDGAGPVLFNTLYTTRAALNQNPGDSWPVPCYTATSHQGLCDSGSLPSSIPTTFEGNPSSSLFFDQSGQRINLTVCADNLPNQSVSVRLSRPGNVFQVVSQTATTNCLTFWNLDGAGPVLLNTAYTTRAALNMPPNDAWPVPCYEATNHQGLCDTGTLSTPGPNLLNNPGFEAGYTSWNWIPTNSSCSRAIYTDTPHGGSQYLATGRSDFYPNCNSVYQDVYTTPQIGDRYTYGVWLRSPWAAQTLSIALWFTGSPGGANAYAVSQNASLDGSWRCYQVTLLVDRIDQNNRFRTQIYLPNANLDVNVDDVYLGYGQVQYCP